MNTTDEILSQWTDSAGRTYRDIRRDGERVAQVLLYPGGISEQWVDWRDYEGRW